MASSSHYLKIDTVFELGKETIVLHAMNKITISSSTFTLFETMVLTVLLELINQRLMFWFFLNCLRSEEYLQLVQNYVSTVLHSLELSLRFGNAIPWSRQNLRVKTFSNFTSTKKPCSEIVIT